PVTLGQRPQALLTTLYRSTDRLCRGGAAVKNLAQSASLHAGENNAPSKPGTKHLSASRRVPAPGKILEHLVSSACEEAPVARVGDRDAAGRYQSFNEALMLDRALQHRDAERLTHSISGLPARFRGAHAGRSRLARHSVSTCKAARSISGP